MSGANTMSPARRVRVVAFVVSFVVALVLAATTATAAAGDGLAITSDTTYSPQPEAGAVDVAATFVLTNVKPTEYFETYTRSYWYETFSFAMLAEATDVAASAAGNSLNITRDSLEEEPTFDVVNIALPRNLNYQQTITLDLSWTLPSGAVRDGALVRVSPSYITFPIIACCDPATTNVRVDIPDGFEVELLGEQGDELVVVDDPPDRRLEALAIEDPTEFVATMFARNDDGLVTDVVKFGPSTAEVRSWPDDPAWADFVADTIENDLPVLEEFIGEPWPLDETLVVVETVSPYLEGYGGTYSSGVIEIGENLDHKIVLHELSHAWLNGELSEERWIIEGLAEEFASRTLASVNPDADPEALHPERPDQTAAVARALQDWPYAAQLHGREDQAEVEEYHYNAAWWVMRGLSDEIGIDALADVTNALADREVPFLGEGEAEVHSGPIDAGRFLDTVEWRGGSTLAEKLLADHVFNRDTTADLADRAAAHEAYSKLLERGGAWAPPLGIRERLTDWDFELATELTDLAVAALDNRDRTATVADDLGIMISGDIEDRFESARFASDFSNLAAAAVTERADLVTIATQRGEVEASAVDLGTVIPAWTSPAAVDDARSEIETRLATLAALADATDLVGADHGLFTRVGLIRSDPQLELAAARKAFAADDSEVSLDRAAMARQLVIDAEDVGRTRVVVGAVAVVGFGLVVVAATIANRRKRHRITG